MEKHPKTVPSAIVPSFHALSSVFTGLEETAARPAPALHRHHLAAEERDHLGVRRLAERTARLAEIFPSPLRERVRVGGHELTGMYRFSARPCSISTVAWSMPPGSVRRRIRSHFAQSISAGGAVLSTRSASSPRSSRTSKARRPSRCSSSTSAPSGPIYSSDSRHARPIAGGSFASRNQLRPCRKG